METFCQYHPTQPASWDCGTCDHSLCHDCVSHKKHSHMGVETEYHLCPKCNQEVAWLGVSNLIKPFWNRLPDLFIYPFALRPLVLNIVLCAAMFCFTGASLVDTLIRFAIWGVWLKYSFASLQTTAKGNLNPPAVNLKTVSDDFHDVFKQLAIYFALMFGFGMVMGTLGKFFGILYAAVAIFCLPSMIILLVATQSFIQALNPVAFIGLPFRIGWGYLLMYFFLVILGSAPAALFSLAGPFLPVALLPFLILFFQNYYTLISYNLMGYVLLQYHEEIGYEVAYEDFIAERESGGKKPPPLSPFLQEVEMHITDGEFDQALFMLRQEIEDKGAKELDVWERYYELLKVKKKLPDMMAHGKRFIERLMQSDKKEKACKVYLECSHLDKQFAVSPKAFVKLAGWLKNAGHFREAIRAYAAFNTAYSEDPMAPVVCFRAAEMFNEQFGKKAKARNLLKGVIKKYPDHHIIPFVESYLKRVQL